MEFDDWFVLSLLVIVTVTWLVLFLLFLLQVNKPATTTSPSPSPSPILPIGSFNSVKTIDGNGTNFYYMSEGYLSFRQIKDMSQWGIDKPLNYTHVKINNLIFKFINPNSSDSSGFVVDDTGNKIQPQPSSQFSNIIEFGFFM